MRHFNFSFFLLLISLFYAGEVSAKISIIGIDAGGSDEFTFVSDTELPAGTVIYFTEDHYSAATNQFGLVEGMISYTVPTGGLPAGRVVLLTEVSSNTHTADDGGTVSRIGTSNWSLSGVSEEIYAFTASNPAAPESSVTLVYCWFLLEGSGESGGPFGVGSDRDPSSDVPVEIILDWNAQLANAEYRRDRSLPTSLSDILDINNWVFNLNDYPISSTDFTGSFTLETALPVTLADFTVTPLGKRSALLAWETTTESQNEGFEIERSLDVWSWETIGFVAGLGNTATAQTYSFVDDLLTASNYYYRLRQLDFGGESTYSPIVNITLEGVSGKSTLAYPNPAYGELTITIPSVEVGVGQLELISATGQTVYRQLLGSRITIPTVGYARGVYFLRVDTGKSVTHQKIILR